MAGPVTKPIQIKKPGDPGYCPSCDRPGLAILAVLYGVIPTQNYNRASTYGYDWVTYMEADSTPQFGDFNQNAYLSNRKLADANSGDMLQCSHYVLRRLRKGYLYVYYSGDNWDKYAVQANGRMVKMKSDMVHAEGIGDASCARLNSLADTALLIVDPVAHPTFWVAFSDAPWTSKVRKMVAGNPAQYMKQVVVSSQKNLVGFEGSNLLQGTVLGFQKKPLLETQDQEAYPRGPMLSADDIYGAMIAHNTDFKTDGLILPLEDDVGITTQLNFSRNVALVDIMGEGSGYTEDDRNKMDTAGVLENIKDAIGDSWSDINDHLKSGEYDKWIAKYHKCTEAKANFNSYSHDYLLWIKYLIGKKIYQLFDHAVPSIGLELAQIVANIFEGCGLTKEEFEQVLEPQLAGDVTEAAQLFWRGATANDHALLALLTDATVDKTIIEGGKKGNEAKEQLSFFQELSEAKIEAAERNEKDWSRLAELLTSKAARLHSKNAKVFRRTMRRIQATALATSSTAAIEAVVENDATGFLQQLENNLTSGHGRAKVTPKNKGQMAALSELLVTQWKAGDPMPGALKDAVNALGIESSELPKTTIIKVGEEAASTTTMRGLMGLNAGMAAVNVFAFVKSAAELGVDLSEAVNTGDVNKARLLKDLSEAGSGLVGAVSGGFSFSAIAQQSRDAGKMSAQFWKLSEIAAGLNVVISAIEFAGSVNEATELWEGGDRVAAGTTVVASGAGVASSLFAYWGVRATARAALEAAAKRAALGTVGEVAVEAGGAAAAEAGGAVIATDTPPAAMILGIAAGVTWASSIALGMVAKHFTTSPLQKWADRCFIGEHKGKWGAPYKETKRQLEDLLRLLYTVKIDKPGYFSPEAPIEVTVPVFGDASQLTVKVDTPGAHVGYFIFDGKDWSDGKSPKIQNLARPPASLIVHAEAERKDAGLQVTIRVGHDNDTSWQHVLGQGVLDGLMPWRGLQRTYEDIKSMPMPQIFYYPNKAAYPSFYVDEQPAKDAEKEKEKA
jgi:hypothetical protein